ncbi:MAG: N-acetyltransferase [Burkholderiaceae bacterium]|nr:N-acetyltransferase [Burkholderiaceae bacterium]
MEFDITNDHAASRFSIEVDGQRCVLDYILQNGTMTITHTGVPNAVGGRGIAAALTHHALETARTRGWKVRPVCSYAVVYIERHPEYQPLVA